MRLEVQDDPDTRILVVRLGPINIPQSGEHVTAGDHFLRIPFDGWFSAFHARLVDASGAVLPERLLHHVVFLNMARRNPLCPDEEEYVFGAGPEMNDWPALPGLGYRITKGQSLRVRAMFRNVGDTPLANTYLELQINYQLLGDKLPLRSFYPTWFSVTQCGRMLYDLKPGRNITAGEFVLAHGGTFVALSGHLHDHGGTLRFENMTKKEDIAVLRAKLDSEGRLVSITLVSFAETNGYRVRPGEVVRVTAVYDNPTGLVLSQSAMGLLVAIFVPDKDEEFEVATRLPR